MQDALDREINCGAKEYNVIAYVCLEGGGERFIGMCCAVV
jgi:hypothetical protein